MDTNDKIRLLLTLQEHPENLTESEVKELMADEEISALLRQLTATKRAFVKQSLHEDKNLVNAEWGKFSRTHFVSSEFKRRWMRIAAIFGGVILSTGLVIATILTVRHHYTPSRQKATTIITRASADNRQIISTDSTDTSVVVFHKSTLADILTDIAAYYNADVEFQNDNARHMRFYFVWKKNYGLEQVIESLNNFEHINIQEDNHHIIVK